MDEKALKATARLHRSFKIARENQIASDERTKARYDVKHKNITFQMGDQVILFTPQFKTGSRKLQMQNRGPFTVTKHLTDLNVEIREN